MNGTTDDAGVLAGVRVLDFGRYIAGPFCAALLADLGADVIRIEKLRGSEDRFLQPVAEDGAGAMFLQCNRGKRGLTLNPMKPEGREVVRRLVRTADVVIANLPPDTIVRMGLDYDTLRAIQPEIILSTVSALGTRGPWANKVGFDGIAQAMSGNAYLTGHADEPMKSWVPYVDFNTATFAALGIVAALLARETGHGGQRVEASLLRTSLTVNNSTLIEQQLLRAGPRGQRQPEPDRRPGRRLPNARWLDPDLGHRPAAVRAGGGAARRPLPADRPALRRRPAARRARRDPQRDDVGLVRGADDGGGAVGVGAGPHPGGARLLAAAGARRRAHPGQRHPGRDRVSRRARAGAGREFADGAVGHAGPTPGPRPAAGRAHGRDPGRAGLRRRRDRALREGRVV